MPSIDGDSLKDSFDYFDNFLKSRSNSAEEELIEEVIEDVDDSSSSYYEEEVIEESLVVSPMRLDTLHENDEIDSDYDSETEPWEEVTDSFHCDSPIKNEETSSSHNVESSPERTEEMKRNHSFDASELADALRANSDMIERVRSMLNDKYSGEGSLVDSSSRCDSTSYDDCGSSSVLPLDFDMGSYADGMPNDSDEEEESLPDDYEEACRAMIATVHPQLDPHTMLHGCDLRNLYINLKQQYGHVLKSVSDAPLTDSSTPVPMEAEPAVIEDDSTTRFVEMSFNSDNDGNVDTVPPEPMVSPEPVAKKPAAQPRSNNSSVIMKLFNIDPVGTGTKEPPKTEKWFHRDADDPEDYEYACRVLCEAMYDPNDPDYDVEIMLSRSSPRDLYRYLKPHYWYLAHTNQLDENGVYLSKYSADEAGEEKQADPSESEESKASNKVDALRSFFAKRAENSDRSKMSQDESTLETRDKTTEMQEEKTSDEFDQSMVSESNNDIEDISPHSSKDETETEMQPSSDDNESVIMEFDDDSEDAGLHSDYDEIEHEDNDASSYEDIDETETEIEENENVTMELNESNEDDHSYDGNNEIEAAMQEVFDEDESVEMEPNESNEDASSYVDAEETEKEIHLSLEESEVEVMDSNDDDEDADSASSDKCEAEMKTPLNESSPDDDAQISEDGQQEPVKQILNDSDEPSDKIDTSEEVEVMESGQKSPSLGAAGESIDIVESQSDRSSDDIAEREVQENLFRKASPNDTAERPLTEKGNPDNSSGEAFHDELESGEPSENLDGLQEDVFENEHSESLNESCGSLWEQYSGEYNHMQSKKTNGEQIDEKRFRLLGLSVKYIRGQRLQEDEIKEVEDFFNQETTIEEGSEGGKDYDSKDNDSLDEQKSPVRKGSPRDRKRRLSAQAKKIAKSKVLIPPTEGQDATINPEELEWRKDKIEKDLDSLIKQTEVCELRAPLSPGVVVALNAGSMKTALTKKYYEPRRRRYVYYPSVAQALQNFSLIEEAEKTFHNEFSFELSTALCTVAASQTRGNENEVNEDDKFVKEATVDVVLKEEDQNTISFSDSFRAKGGKAGLESPDQTLSEKEVRLRRIKNDLERVIKDAEVNHLDGKIEVEAIDALGRAANEIVFIKKYYDVDTDMFKYFPSVKKTILNCSLMERAEDFYFDGMQDFPLDYSSALKAAAARFRTDFIEVDELDDYVINMAVDVDIGIEGNQSNRSRDFSMTTDTASMMSSQTTEATAHEQTNELDDINEVDKSATPEEIMNQNENFGITQAAFDEKSALLMQKYLEKRQKIDEALVDLESELVAEMSRLDKEAADCNLKHKVEAERIEKDKRAVHEKAIKDAKQSQEKVKALREELSGTVAILQFDVNGALSGMEADTGKEGWGSWLTGKPKVDKEKQKRMTKTKQRKAELESKVSQIKSELAYVNQQAKAKRESISEWKAELEEEYRHLTDLTSATEAKLKEEMMYLKASYEEEKQRLLNQRNLLEEIKGEDQKWGVSQKSILDNVDAESESEEEKSTQSGGTATTEEELTGQANAETDEDLLVVSAPEGTDDSNNDSTTPIHLASLNQPRDASEEASLGSFDIFDVAEDEEASIGNSEAKTQPTEQGKEVKEKERKNESPIDSPVALGATAKRLSSKKFLAAALKGKQKADNDAAAEAEPVVKRVDSVDRIQSTVASCPETPKSPAGKSLRDMKRKVEEALDRAMTIRNGSSRHSRSIPLEIGPDQSGRRGLRSINPSPISASRKSVNPIYPMVKEIDRLQGFMRRYEKKLETACKTVLTLASVAKDEKEISDARQLELPEMLEFVVNQDFYKEHSRDKESNPPQLLFAKSKTDGAEDIRYSITPIGKSFFDVEGPVASDVSRFLTYLNKIEDGLTRDSMKAQWKEIANLSGDEQSQRVCDNLDKLISFCLDSHMIQK